MRKIYILFTVIIPLSIGVANGQKNVSKKIIGTWVLKSSTSQDTIAFLKDHKFSRTNRKKKSVGIWSVSIHSSPKEDDELFLLPNLSEGVILQPDSLRPFKFQKQHHPYQILKLSRKRMIMKTFISYDELDQITWFKYEFIKIK